MGQGGGRGDDDPKASASRRQGGLSGGWREEPEWREVMAELGEALLGGKNRKKNNPANREPNLVTELDGAGVDGGRARAGVGEEQMG